MPKYQRRNSQQTQPQQPKPEPITIKAIVGSISETLTDFMVRVKVEARRGNVRVDGNISVIEGIDPIDTFQLINGDGFYHITEPLASAGSSRTLTFILDGPQDIRGEAVVKFPEKETKKRETKPDPEELQVTRHRQADGTNTLFVRVVDAVGNGVKTIVQICAEGHIHDVPTDKNGMAIWAAPKKLKARKTVDADVCVSGISEKAKVVLRGPRPHDPKRGKVWTKKWWFKENNGRGVLLLIAMVAIWILALVIGPGDPLISFDHTQLSPQELFYNLGTDNYKVVVDKAPTILHVLGNAACKFVWFFLAPILTIFAILYFVFSLREEVAEGIIEGLELLVDRPYVKAQDPLAERVMSWAGVRSTARKNPVQPTITTPQPQTEESAQTEEKAKHPRRHVPFWELFRSDLASDLLVEVIPQVLRHFFR